MAKLKSFEEYIATNIDTADEIEKDMIAMGEPETKGDGDEVQSQDQKIGAEEVEDETSGEEAGQSVEDMPTPLTKGEEDMKIDGEVVDTDPKDGSDDILNKMEDAEELEVEEVEESNELNEASYTISRPAITRMNNIVSSKLMKSLMDLVDPIVENFINDGFELNEIVGYIAYKIADEFEGIYESKAEAIKEEETETTKEVKTVDEMLKEAYNSLKNEAKVWEEDMHDEHTIESYLKENAALVATLAANSLREMKKDIALEAYESTCNTLKESYSKKMDEMKESYSSMGEESDSE